MKTINTPASDILLITITSPVNEVVQFVYMSIIDLDVKITYLVFQGVQLVLEKVLGKHTDDISGTLHMDFNCTTVFVHR